MFSSITFLFILTAKFVKESDLDKWNQKIFEECGDFGTVCAKKVVTLQYEMDIEWWHGTDKEATEKLAREERTAADGDGQEDFVFPKQGTSGAETRIN